MLFCVFRWWKRNAKQANQRHLFHDLPLQVSLTLQDQWKAQRRQRPRWLERVQEFQRLKEALTFWRTWRGYSRRFGRMILSGIDDCLTYKYPQLIESKQFFHVMVLSTCFVVSFAQAEPNSLHGRINNRAVLVRLEMQNGFLWANKKPPAIGLVGLLTVASRARMRS